MSNPDRDPEVYADSSLYFPEKLQLDLEILTITSFLEYWLGGSF